MITPEVIEEVKKRLVQVYNPLEIYLFGSYAWGNPDEQSDLDLLIVIEKSDEKRHKRSIHAADSLWDLKIPKELLVYTKDEFARDVKDATTFCHMVKEEGKLLYARS